MFTTPHPGDRGAREKGSGALWEKGSGNGSKDEWIILNAISKKRREKTGTRVKGSGEKVGRVQQTKTQERISRGRMRPFRVALNPDPRQQEGR